MNKGWIWLGTGVVTALLVGLLAYLIWEDVHWDEHEH
jgi:hypothetical protein